MPVIKCSRLVTILFSVLHCLACVMKMGWWRTEGAKGTLAFERESVYVFARIGSPTRSSLQDFSPPFPPHSPREHRSQKAAGVQVRKRSQNAADTAVRFYQRPGVTLERGGGGGVRCNHMLFFIPHHQRTASAFSFSHLLHPPFHSAVVLHHSSFTPLSPVLVEICTRHK